jgi:hypothetical protein
MRETCTSGSMSEGGKRVKGGLTHRRVAKAGGNSYSPALKQPRPSSTLQYQK